MIGAPGGAEWLIIIAVIVLLFVPSLLMFGVGFLVGKKTGQHREPNADSLRVEEASTATTAGDTATGEAISPGDDVDG